LHPNRWLSAVLIILHILRLFKVPEFVDLGFVTMIGRYKSLLRPLMLRSLVPWCMMPRGLIFRPETMVLDSMEHDKESDAMKSDTGPKVLCHNLLVWALLS
jgi:hypothetical protein